MGPGLELTAGAAVLTWRPGRGHPLTQQPSTVYFAEERFARAAWTMEDHALPRLGEHLLLAPPDRISLAEDRLEGVRFVLVYQAFHANNPPVTCGKWPGERSSHRFAAEL